MLFYNTRLFLQVQTVVVTGFLCLISGAANAATWYVDSSVANSGNGTSWASAWKNISNITGVAAGDTVYISGGPSGSSQNYVMTGSWSPKGGSAGNPIIYQIGQDLAHNGTVTFSGNGTWAGPANYVTISGDAGDGKMHFTISGYSSGINNNSTVGFHISYVNLGSNLGSGVDGQGVTQFQLDHCYCYIVGSADHFLSCGIYDPAFDGSKMFSNTIYVPHQQNSANGADAFQITGSGVSLFNNLISGYNMNWTAGGSQHQDGIQTLLGSYLKIYGNTFQNLVNSSVYMDGYYGAFAHIYIYNNIVQITDAADSSGPEGITVESDGSPAVMPSFTDVIVANNSIFDTKPYNGSCIDMGNCPGCDGGKAVPMTGVYCYNNVYVNSGGLAVYSPVVLGDNVSFTLTTDNGDFVSYTPQTANNDYHLTSAATTLIGKATNLSSYFNTDKDGNARPATGNWDIGAYQYGTNAVVVANPPSTNPVISISPVSLNFGSVLANATTNMHITVSNAGSGILSGKASVAAPFSIVAGGSYNLSSNAAQVVTVGYAPTVAGLDNQTIYFTNTLGGVATATVTGLSYVIQSSLSFSSTNGTIIAPFAATGNYVSQATDTSAASVAGGGQAIYGFTINTPGSYYVTANVLAPSDGQNSLFVSIDTLPTDPTNIWDCVITTNFLNEVVSLRGGGNDTNDQFSPMTFNLTAGVHELIIVGREAGTEIGAISILPVGSASTPPTGVAIVPTPPTFGIRLITNEPGVTNTVEASWSGVNSGGVSISWGDGNNTTSTEAVGIQDYKFNTSGNYTIGFTYTDANGSVLTTNQSITAY
jgi:hypothetical protein